MTAGTQPSRALLIAAGTMTQVIGAVCLILALASIPVAHDLKTGMSGVLASIVASLAAIVCGTLVWRGRLVPLALAAGLDVGFGIGLPRGGSAIGAILRILPADEIGTAETVIMIAAVMMFIAAVMCVIAVPSALKLRQWARDEIERESRLPDPGITDPGTGFAIGTDTVGRDPVPAPDAVSDSAPTNERPKLEPNAGSTLKGFGAQAGTHKLMPTQIVRPAGQPQRYRLAIIAGVAATVTAIGIIVITAATGSDSPRAAAGSASSGSSVTSIGDDSPTTTITIPLSDGGAVASTDAVAPAMTIDQFLAKLHAALATAQAAELAALFDDKAFAFGVESHDLAEGRDAIVAQLREDLGEAPAKGFAVTVKFAHVASDGDIAWFAEELRVGDKQFVVTAVAGLRGGTWTIAALHWATAMSNDTAYRLAREGELAVPDAIPDSKDTSQLATAMRAAFASKAAFVEARSTRADAFNFGSASGERLKGGDAIRRIFSRIKATIRLHDAVKVGTIGERGGWGIANVDFTDADKEGTEVTQTFRVLAAWIEEDAGWRIVQTQWSNAR